MRSRAYVSREDIEGEDEAKVSDRVFEVCLLDIYLFDFWLIDLNDRTGPSGSTHPFFPVALKKV